MLFDLKMIPFSKERSYMVISDNEADFFGYGNEPGLYLRTIHASKTVPFISKLIPQEEGKAAEYTCEAAPTELRLNMRKAQIQICFADDKTLLFRGMGDGAGITFDFLTKDAHYDYIYEIPCKDQVRYMANCFKNNCRYLIWAQEGNAAVDQKWKESTAEYSRLKFRAQEGRLLIVLKEIETEWDGKPEVHSYEQCRRKTAEEFQKFHQAMPAVPRQFEKERETASYLNWSGIVRKDGFLTRDAMYMSKNWMCNVWSWDHCFNAVALSYGHPDKAWDQLMLMFDHQDKTGLIPDSVNDVHIVWNYCKPPIHGWALLKMMRHMKLTDKQAAEGYRRLAKWTEWWLKYRDHDHDGICEYNHGNDSGWDNSTAFSVLPPVELPELQAYLILQMEALERLAIQLEKNKQAQLWKQRSEQMLADMLRHCFENNLPKAVRNVTHEIVENDSLILYEAIVLGKRLPEAIRDRMIEVLKSDKFLTEFGYATESPKSRHYVADGYWRGPIWAPSTMILLDGLYQCGEVELVKEVTQKFCRMIQDSGFAENFDALTGKGLRDMAYTWTSSAFLSMAHDYLL